MTTTNTAPATTTQAQAAVVPVVGFTVKKFVALPPSPKNEEDMGKIQLILEAETNDVRAVNKDVADIFGALNMHRVTREPVAVQLRF